MTFSRRDSASSTSSQSSRSDDGASFAFCTSRSSISDSSSIACIDSAGELALDVCEVSDPKAVDIMGQAISRLESAEGTKYESQVLEGTDEDAGCTDAVRDGTSGTLRIELAPGTPDP